MDKIVILAFSCLLLSYMTLAQTPATDPHWQLKWEDHFDSFDTNRWIKANNAYREDEPQLLLKENVWVSNGNLVIAVNNNKVRCPNPAPSEVEVGYACIANKQYNYTSGWVETKHNLDIEKYPKYGYIEARIKLPYRAGKQWGFWPAFWTYQENMPNTKNAAEIDIFEVYGSNNSPNLLETNIHTCYGCNEDYLVKHILPNFNYSDWHTYAIEWNSDRIIWYVDGKVTRSMNNHGIVDHVRIILNLSIEKNAKYHPPTSPFFQEYMYVDYIKVYGLKCDKNTVINEIPNFNTYNHAVKKSISMSNATTIPTNSNIALRANDFIELKPGFEVQTGRELYLDINPCNEIESNVKIIGNRPNPFTDYTVIEGYIPDRIVNAKLQIFDKCGSLVKNLTISERGTVNIEIRAGELPHAGRYTYIITGDEETSETEQMVLME